MKVTDTELVTGIVKIVFSIIVTAVYYISLLPAHDLLHELAHARVAHRNGAKAYILLPSRWKEGKYVLGGVDVYFVKTGRFRTRFGSGKGGFSVNDSADEKVQRKITFAGPVSDFSYVIAAFLADILVFFLISDNVLRMDMFIMLSVIGVIMVFPNWVGHKKEIEAARKKVSEASLGTELDISFSDGTKIWYQDEIMRIHKVMADKNLFPKESIYDRILMWINENT